MVEQKRSKLVLILGIAFAVFTILPILAPLFAWLELEFLSDPIYWIYQWFCHQRPWRSYHLFDYQFAMDARMMSMFSSMAISAFIIYIKKIRPLKTVYSIILAIIFIFPLAFDGTIQAIAEIVSYRSDSLSFYESTNLVRAVTGVLFGAGFSFAFFPSLNELPKKTEKIKKFFIYLVLSSVMSFLLIPLFVLAWSITSTKYKPSSTLFDYEERFPGYNYEISRSASHSTLDKRVLNEPLEKYIRRAEAFEKEEILNDYYKRHKAN